MIKHLKDVDAFGKNIILVFLGATMVNFFNLLYRALIAHRLNPADFAAFSSLFSVFSLVSSPLGPINTAIAKYTAEFNVRKEKRKVQALFAGFLRKILGLSLLTLLAIIFATPYIMSKLKIQSVLPGYILAAMLSLSWIMLVLSGVIQGLEFFWWLMSISVVIGALKLAFVFLFMKLGFGVAGALGAFLISISIGIIISFFPLRRIFSLRLIASEVNFKEIFLYLFPVGASVFCYNVLFNIDMILVKHYFTPEESGFYSLAQMVGLIFLFLPGAISIVMLPRASGLNAKNMDTVSTMKRSLVYAAALCVIAALLYNTFPSLVLKVFTGKVFSESLTLGRLFSVSMSFLALLYVFIIYFLSIKDLRFIKYLILCTCLQCLAIILFHRSLMQVQMILCINAISLFLIHFMLFAQKQIKAS
jgi:O-antigen/teichoic acid export membrane protein